MTVQNPEGFLKYLNNVGLELASLLDLDGQAASSRKRAHQGRQTKARSLRIKSSSSSTTSSSGPMEGTARGGVSKQPATRVKGKRKSASSEMTTTHHKQNDNQLTIDHSTGSSHHHHHHHPPSLHLVGGEQMQLDHDLNHKLAQHSNLINGQPTDAHTLDSQGLTLSITVDELHGSSLSPVTHLSPIDSSSIQSFHQQHFYNPPRSHLELYPLHDDFPSDGHDTIPITSHSSSHAGLGGQQQDQQVRHHHSSSLNSSMDGLSHHHQSHHLNQSHQHHQHHHHQQEHQQQQPPQPNTSTTTLAEVNSQHDCSYQPQIHHHQQQHHQQHQQPTHGHHQQMNQQTIHPYHHQIEQPWLGASSMGLQLGSTVDSLDHVVPLSPVAHQSLDQVQFGTSLYHQHHNYYGHQAEPLDSFQQSLASDDFATSINSLANNSNSPLQQSRQTPRQSQPTHTQPQHNHHHQHHHHHHHHQQQHQQQHLQVNIDNNYDHQHHLQQQHQQQQHHLHHHDQTAYTNHLGSLQSQHHQHSSQNQMMPLINGLEPSGVILQDINLASASWSSPEDLYSI